MLLGYRILLVVVALNGAFYAGWMVNGWRIGNAQIVANNNQISALAEIEQLAAVSENSVLRFTADQSREVIKYVVKNPTDCSLSFDGLQLWQTANAGTASSTNNGLPVSPTARIGQPERFTFQSHRSDGALPSLPPTARRFEQMGQGVNQK